MSSMQRWLDNTSQPEQACNHFTQLQWRNIARAQINLGMLDQASETLNFLQQEANAYHLVTDNNRNLIVETVLATAQNDDTRAKIIAKTSIGAD